MIGHLLKKIAPKIGARVVVEPEWGVAGQITFKNGKRSYFRFNSIGINPLGAAEISKDKDYANFFMRTMGYPTITGKAFYSDEHCQRIGSTRGIDDAYAYAKKLDFPVIVKPNSGSQGTGVFLIRSKKQFFRAMRDIFLDNDVALVQRVVRGKDYRIVVLDNKIISAYERIPLSVVGDGSSTIAYLLRKKQRQFSAARRDTRLKLDDIRIAHKLGLQRLALRTVPERGQRVFLLDNANLSSGGEAVDVTKPIHPEFKKIAVNLTRDMGLRLCGVDLMVRGDIRNKPRKYWVLEVNATPGLDNYVKSGHAQQKLVEGLYLKVLKSLAK